METTHKIDWKTKPSQENIPNNVTISSLLEHYCKTKNEKLLYVRHISNKFFKKGYIHVKDLKESPKTIGTICMEILGGNSLSVAKKIFRFYRWHWHEHQKLTRKKKQP